MQEAVATADRLLAEAQREVDGMLEQGKADIVALGAHLQQRRQQAEDEIQRMLDNALRTGARPQSRPPADPVDRAFERAAEPNGNASPSTASPDPATG